MARRIARAKRKKITNILLCVLVISVAFGTAFFLSVRQIKNKYEAENEKIKEQYDAVQSIVYVATTDIPAGGIIDKTTVKPSVISTSMDSGLYINENDLGKIAVVDIRKGQSIFANMIGTDLAAYLRECEYAMLTLNSNLKKNDFIDVRIMYPNGENYTVLSKKSVKGINFETNEIYLWNNEEDIMKISSAIVDVYLHDGAILYTTKYIEDGQSATIVNYQPSEDVMAAMANNPNLLKEATSKLNASMRESIDARLDQFEGNDVSLKKNVNLNGSITLGGIADSDATVSSSEVDGTEKKDISSDYIDESTTVYDDEENKINQDEEDSYEY